MTELYKLTGFQGESEIAEVLFENPRAYMALRGAIAEKHLEKLLEQWKANGDIREFRAAAGDFDKDFYIETNRGNQITLECKNVQVLNLSNKEMKISYLKFLVEEEYLDMSLQSDIETLSSKQLVELINQLPQAFRESGLPRYHFSVSLVEENFAGTEEEYLHLFDKFPLSIDFQRTRNSRGDGADGKENRFYRLEEIDYVGACLFSRTLGWTFIFAHASCFPIHPKFTERYSNSLKIMPGEWHRSLIQLLETRNE